MNNLYIIQEKYANRDWRNVEYHDDLGEAYESLADYNNCAFIDGQKSIYRLQKVVGLIDIPKEDDEELMRKLEDDVPDYYNTFGEDEGDDED